MGSQHDISFKKRRLNELNKEKGILEAAVLKYDEEHGTRFLIPEKIEMHADEENGGLYSLTMIQGALLTPAEAAQLSKFLNIYAVTHGVKGI